MEPTEQLTTRDALSQRLLLDVYAQMLQAQAAHADLVEQIQALQAENAELKAAKE